VDSLTKLIADWRAQAAVLDGWGAHHEAKAARRCATELEARILEWQLEALTLKEAERESEYSY
jgi:hypothetical protein